MLRSASTAVAFILLIGCTDAAAPDFERCLVLEAEAKFSEALAACEMAKSKAPDSDAGKKADARIPGLRLTLEREREREKK